MRNIGSKLQCVHTLIHTLIHIRTGSEAEESEFGGVVLGEFGGPGGKGRVKGLAVDGDGSLEARVVVGSIFHGRVLWKTPLLLVAKFLQPRLVHSLSLSLSKLFSSFYRA
jgi:hypothetical protein